VLRYRNSIEGKEEQDSGLTGLCIDSANPNQSFHVLRSLLDQVTRNKSDGSSILCKVDEKTRRSSRSNLKRTPMKIDQRNSNSLLHQKQ